MKEKALLRIVTVDDHPIVRAGLVAIINAQPDMTVVAEAGDGEEAVKLYALHRPDVMLMDLRLPKASGASAIASIRADFPHACLLVLTTYDGDEDIHRAMLAGARGYLLKGMPFTELVDAIRRVHAGETCMPKQIRARLDARPHNSDLTPREIQIVELIGTGKSNKEIGAVLKVAETTVKWHVNIIMGKLNVDDRTAAVTVALRRGIVQI